MLNIYDYTLEELKRRLHPPFRAKQLYHWLYHRYEEEFEKMHNLSKEIRQKLTQDYSATLTKVVREEVSEDGSRKYLFQTHDGLTYEAVLLKMKEKKEDEEGRIVEGEKYTICVSSQVGCKVGCSFCFTAKGGFVRNLSAGEIVYQIVALKRLNALAPEKRVNIVYMGMGEPLDNFENLIQAIRILSELDGLSISTKRQTISTSGIAPKIEKLGALNLGVQLAISLHAVDDELRTRLIPMNKAYNIASIIEAVRRFPIDSRKRVMFEYLVIKGVNDDEKSAKTLLKLLNGIKSKVNLIYFNPHEGSEFERPLESKMVAFQKYLIDRGLLCTIRESKGIDISAACGQLREKIIKEENCGNR